MKQKTFLAITAVLIITGGVIMLFDFLRPCIRSIQGFDFSDIVRFEYNYLVGNYMYGNVCYSLVKKDGAYEVSVKQNLVAEENADIFAADKEFVQQLENILTENNVGRWNGFDKTDRNVLDGRHFTMFADNQNGEYFSASGYEKWPVGYAAVKKELDKLFMSLYQ